MNFVPIFARELRAAMQGQRLRKERLRVGTITALALAAALLAEQWVSGFNLKNGVSMVPLGAIGPLMLLVAAAGESCGRVVSAGLGGPAPAACWSLASGRQCRPAIGQKRVAMEGSIEPPIIGLSYTASELQSVPLADMPRALADRTSVDLACDSSDAFRLAGLGDLGGPGIEHHHCARWRDRNYVVLHAFNLGSWRSEPPSSGG